MSSLLLILLSAVLVCHYAPALVGMRVFEETEAYSGTLGIAVAMTIMLSVIAPLSYAMEQALLVRFGIEYLRPFALIIVVMAVAQSMAVTMPRLGPWTPVQPMFVMLMTLSGTVLGVALFAAQAGSLADAFWAGVAAGFAFSALFLAFTTLQRRLLAANIPLIFRDAPIALITTGLMALALMGLTGIVRD